MSFLLGQNVKGYQLRELIGEGGFGAVYKAFQPGVGREVAVKIILPEYANQPDFIRRFEVEAQLVARLEHPFIVPLFDYWREPDGAYLVMRLLRGGNLREAIRRGPARAVEVARLLDQIAAALSVAHQNGIVHRDLKPANILLDESANAYLSDFGIAKSVNPLADSTSNPDIVIGSPAYASPEQIMGDPVTPQADLYSLGIIIYEMLTGQHPFQDATLTAMLVKQAQEPLPPLQALRPDLPSGLDKVIKRVTSKRPTDRYVNAFAVAAAFRKVLTTSRHNTEPAIMRTTPSTAGNTAPLRVADITPTPSTPTDVEVLEPENPYKGLRAFQEADVQDFFGRDALVQRLVERMGQTDDAARFMAVVGPSGSGKSSVIRAGLLPALRRGVLPGSENWFVVDISPGAYPLEELEAVLLSVAVNPPVSLLSQLKEDNRGLVRAIKRVLPRDERTELVLFIDQFEELFTLTQDEAVRAHFLDSLLAALVEPNGRFRLILALRADFYDRPLLYPQFGDLVRQRTEVILPLAPGELERAITGPAHRVAVTLEPGLVSVIVADVSQQPGALPLLQYALTELFERRNARRLTLDAYHAIGGVLGALARRAEELYMGLDAASQEAARQLFLRLVEPGRGTDNTRRRVLRSELTSVSPAIDGVIDIFGKNRLFTFDRDPGTRSPTVEVAHEALVGEWSRLRDWINASAENLRLQRILSAAAAEWRNAGKDSSFLASGVRLSQFELLSTDHDLGLTQDEIEFIQSGIEHREADFAAEVSRRSRELVLQRRAANRLRYLAVALSIFLLIASGLSIFALNSRSAAVEQSNISATQRQLVLDNAATARASFERLAASESRRLAAEATGILDSTDHRSVDLAILLAIRALNTAYSPEADSVLLRGLTYTNVRQQFIGHSGAVNSVAFSPDARTVVTGGDDNTVRLWDTQSGVQLRQLTGHTDSVQSVAFSPDGKQVLSGSYDNTARLWDVASGAELHQFTGHTGFITSVAFSPDGKYVLTGSRDKTARLWDASTGKMVRTFTGSQSFITAVTFAPDGRSVIVGNLEGQVRRLETSTGDGLQVFTGHQAYVTAVQFSANGKYLVTASTDKTARLWDTTSATEIYKFIGHTDSVISAAISADGKYVVTSSLDSTVRLWDTSTGQEIHQYLGHQDYVKSVAMSADGKLLVTGSRDRTARLWDVQSTNEAREYAGHDDAIISVTMSPDGKTVLTGSADGTARLWDTASGRELRQLTGHTGAVIAIFSADGKTILTGGADNTARLWDAVTGAELHTLSGHTNRILSIAFSPEGSYALTGSADNTARVWDVADGSVFHELTGHAGAVTAKFSVDGKSVLTASADGTARLWDTTSGNELGRFQADGGSVIADISPDGKTVLTGASDGTARLWDAATGRELHVLNGHTGALTAVEFSLDSSSVLTASADGAARLWDAATGLEWHRLLGHADAINAAIFSPDGKYVLTGSADKTARVWNASTGDEVRRISGHAGAILTAYDLAFSPDGTYVLTGSADKTARLWNAYYTDLVAMACKHVFRDFTVAERARFNINDADATCSRDGASHRP